jgi:hypothetical protein
MCINTLHEGENDDKNNNDLVVYFSGNTDAVTLGDSETFFFVLRKNVHCKYLKMKCLEQYLNIMVINEVQNDGYCEKRNLRSPSRRLQ